MRTEPALTRAMLDAWIWSLDNLKPTERLLALALASHWMPSNRKIYPSINRLAKMLRCSPSTISRAKKGLKRKKIFSFKQRKYKAAKKAHDSTMVRVYETRVVEWARTTGYIDPTAPKGEDESPKFSPVELMAEEQKAAHDARIDAKLKCPGGFQRIVKAYPMQSGIEDAWELYQKRNPSPEEVDQIIEGIQRWLVSGRWSESRYIPTLLNFLRKRAYNELEGVDPNFHPDFYD